MRFIADFHVHSKYSRATSRSSDLEHLDLWGRRKGLAVVGTGDFTHPEWFSELRKKLLPAEDGLFTLKKRYGKGLAEEFLPPRARRVRFLLTTEISSIYKRNGRVRKVHNLLFAPDFETAGRIRKKLDAIGNLASDGRPILGLDSRDLLEITLDSSDDAFLVPAHIWTPHFSMLGSKSGFDSLDECFDDLSDYVFAAETGLSSDPPMNRRLSQLDRIALISNSDAHSPSRLGREANLFDTELSYPAIKRALENPETVGFSGTIEFFPEEGKYHYDGHRSCGMRMKPSQSKAAGGLCPTCGRKATLGVLHRVEELADRAEGFRPANGIEYVSLIPLQEILGEILGRGPATKTVMKEYKNLIENVGSEIAILKDYPVDEFGEIAPPRLKEAIRKMRQGRVSVLPGYDGEYGTVSVLGERDCQTEITLR